MTPTDASGKLMFRTPLEFWQWAMALPGQRKGVTRYGDLAGCVVDSTDGSVRLQVVIAGASVASVDLTHKDCPITESWE